MFFETLLFPLRPESNYWFSDADFLLLIIELPTPNICFCLVSMDWESTLLQNNTPSCIPNHVLSAECYYFQFTLVFYCFLSYPYFYPLAWKFPLCHFFAPFSWLFPKLDCPARPFSNQSPRLHQRVCPASGSPPPRSEWVGGRLQRRARMVNWKVMSWNTREFLGQEAEIRAWRWNSFLSQPIWAGLWLMGWRNGAGTILPWQPPLRSEPDPAAHLWSVEPMRMVGVLRHI